jgi:hypothetical protein
MRLIDVDSAARSPLAFDRPVKVGRDGGLRPGRECIGADLFGAVQTGFGSFDVFRSRSDLLGLSNVRWPGGGLAERKPDAYGLDVPGIFDGRKLCGTPSERARPDLARMLGYASERGVAFSMVIPTARYARDVPAGVAHLARFTRDLCDGVHGALPERIILEIGDEYYSQDAFAGNAALYGEVANRFVETIREVVAARLPRGSETRVGIAVQMGATWSDDAAIRAEMSDAALGAIDALVFHHLPISLRNAHRTVEAGHPEDTGKNRFERTKGYYEAWRKAILETGGEAREPDLYLSSWSVGSTAPAPRDQIRHNDYGLRGASTAVDLIYNYTRIGVNMAAVWGGDIPNPVRTSQGGSKPALQPFAAMLGMMTETLQGTVALPGGEDYCRDLPGSVFLFMGEDRLVLYVTVNELPAEDRTFTLRMGRVDPAWPMSARVLEAVLPPAYAQFEGTDESRIHEVPIIRKIAPKWTENGLQLRFTQSYSVIEVSIALPRGADFGAGAGGRVSLARPVPDFRGRRPPTGPVDVAEQGGRTGVALGCVIIATLSSLVLTTGAVMQGWGLLAALGVFAGSQIIVFSLCILALMLADQRARREAE